MSLELRILGPLAVVVDGHVSVLRHSRRRTLLTALLMGDGRRVLNERLGAALWEDPPPSATSNLRTYVADLRRILGRHGDRLGRCDGGYLLRVEPGELDRHSWEADVAAGRQAFANREYAAAADHLGRALDRWSGAAAEAVPRLGAVGRSLDSLDADRLFATEWYAQACLHAGRFAPIVHRLRPFVADHPTRELAWRLLMIALDATGDRGAALETYTVARQAIIAEVGVEPGEELREMQRLILRGDSGAALATVQAATAAVRKEHGAPDADAQGRADTPVDQPPAEPATAPPRTLPAAPQLVGRDPMLAEIGQVLSDSARATVVALHGPAGVGKSALAVQAAHELAASCPDGQIYIDMCGSTPGLTPVTAAEAVNSVLRALGVRPGAGTTADAAARMRSAMAGRRLLLLLDNVVDAAQIRTLLPGVAGTATIVTSRRMLSTLDVQRHLAVTALTPDASRTLLARISGPGRVAADSAAVAELTALCGHLPLALRIVGARLLSRPDWSVESMVGRLADERHRLDELSFDDLAVRSGLAVACDSLADRAAGDTASTLFVRWGLVCVPHIGVAMAQSLLDSSAATARAALDRLAEARLIEPLREDRYQMHDLVRLYARERGDAQCTASERDETLHRARIYYLGTARRARDLLRVNTLRLVDEFVDTRQVTTFADQPAALDWFETERGNLLAALRQSGREDGAGCPRFVTRMAAELYPFLPMRGHYRDWLEVARLALAAARRCGGPDDEAVALTHLGGAYQRVGHFDDAVAALRTALTLQEQRGNAAEVAVVLDHLGIALAAAKELTAARDCFHRSLALHKANESHGAVGITLNNLADVHLLREEPADALRCLRESLRLRRRLGDSLGLGVTILTIGQVHAHEGRYVQALSWLARALTAVREAGNREAEWRALTVRAQLHRSRGLRDQARQDLVAALTISEEIGDPITIAEVRDALDGLVSAGG